MFHHIEGLVTDIYQNMVAVDCNGMGFAVFTSSNSISTISTGKKTKFYISESISENNFDLYGFTSREEKRCFDLLISVSGIGPKAAVSILSFNRPDELALAVINGNEKALTAAPGIGKKTAQRVLLELKDKMDLGSVISATPIAASASVSVRAGENKAFNDAVTGLVVLGYTNSEIAAVLKDIDTNGMNTGDIIKTFLKKNSGGGR